MTRSDFERHCREKADELLEKYFPNFIQEAAVEKPETLAAEYNDELPFKIETEFRNWLAEHLKEVDPSGKLSIDTIMNRHLSMTEVDASYIPHLKDARYDAETLTLWEKITKSNHSDVTYYKGLLREYAQNLMKTMIKDFAEDVY